MPPPINNLRIPTISTTPFNTNPPLPLPTIPIIKPIMDRSIEK